MKTLKKIILFTFIIGGIFTSVQLTKGSGSVTNQSIIGLGDRISAGPDAVVSQHRSFTLQGYCTFNGFIVWTTSGDGVFDNPYNRNANYTPGVQDNNLGHATLAITLVPHGNNPSREITDSMILSITD